MQGCEFSLTLILPYKDRTVENPFSRIFYGMKMTHLDISVFVRHRRGNNKQRKLTYL